MTLAAFNILPLDDWATRKTRSQRLLAPMKSTCIVGPADIQPDPGLTNDITFDSRVGSISKK